MRVLWSIGFWNFTYLIMSSLKGPQSIDGYPIRGGDGRQACQIEGDDPWLYKNDRCGGHRCSHKSPSDLKQNGTQEKPLHIFWHSLAYMPFQMVRSMLLPVCQVSKITKRKLLIGFWRNSTIYCRRWFLELLEQNCPHHIKGLENLV